MKRILNLATTALTIKALWWDKLSPEKKQQYTEKAKDLFNKNKDVVATKGKILMDAKKDLLVAKGDVLAAKGKEFVAEKKAEMQEKKAELNEQKEAIETKTDSVNEDLGKHVEPTPLLKDEPPIHTPGRLDVPADFTSKKSDTVPPGAGNQF